jgi:integrase
MQNLVLPIVKLALVTAMRRGELLTLKWTDIDLNKQTAHIPLTKHDDSRTVPLSADAIDKLKGLARNIDGKVFSITNCSSTAIKRRRTKANIDDFNL